MNVKDSLEHFKTCELSDRIKLLDADLASGRDEYRSIEVFELAGLLEIPIPPDGSWTQYRQHCIKSMEEYLDSRGWPEELAEEILGTDSDSLLSQCLSGIPVSKSSVNASTYQRIATGLFEGGTKFLETLTKDEIDAIRLACAYHDFISDCDNGLNGRSIYSIDSESDLIVFDALIEDDGDCIEMQSPYDIRDGEKARNKKLEQVVFEDFW